MIAKKKKFKKKEIKEDKLVASFYKTKDFYEENSSKIMMIIVPIAVIIVAFILYNNKLETDNVEANEKLSKIIPVYEVGNYQEAIDGQPGAGVEGLLAITEDYGSSEQGNLAKVYLGNAYYFLQKYEEALSAYEGYSGSNDILLAASVAGQASCYEAKDQLEKAANLYEEAGSISKLNPNSAKYLLNASSIYAKIGNFSKGEELVKIINKEYSTSSAASDLPRVKAKLKL